MADFPWLTTIILFPIAASLLIPVLPDKDGKTVRWYSLIVGLIDFALIVYVFSSRYDFDNPELQLVESYSWIPQLDLNWSVGVDGISMPLVILTGFITTLAILAAWPVTLKPRLFYFLILAMYGGQIAVFAVQDMLLFFLVWELELVPVYFLLSIWGGKKRQYAATKFILYTAGGSLFILIAALMMGFYGDTVTFDMRSLAVKDYALNFQLWVYAGFPDCLRRLSCRFFPYTPGFQMLMVKQQRLCICYWLEFSENGRLCSNSDECSNATRCPRIFCPSC
jgi:NAD(P)H-quinone oxidoreductase subunit 4